MLFLKDQLPLNKITPFNKKAQSQKRYLMQTNYQSLQDLKNDQNLVSLTNLGDSMYYITLELGSEKQELNFQIDTLLWVDTTLCKAGECHTADYFDYKKSTTSYYSDKSINFTYVAGQLQCYLGSDYVGIVGQNLQVNTTLCYAYQEKTYSNQDTQISGIIGLNNGDSYTNLIDSLYSAGNIASNRFALSLQHYYTNKESYLYIADGIPESISSQTKWINVSTKTRWSLKCIGLYLNDTEDITSTISSQPEVLFDSGTTLTYVTKDLYNRIVSDLTDICTVISEDKIACPCFSSQLPSYTFYFEGVKFNLTSKHYLINQENNFAYCQLGIYYLDNFSMMIFGDTVLVTLPVSYDKTENQIGLAGLPSIENITSNGYSITIICFAGLITIILFPLIVFQCKVRKYIKNSSSETQNLLSSENSQNDKPGLPTNRSDANKSIFE